MQISLGHEERLLADRPTRRPVQGPGKVVDSVSRGLVLGDTPKRRLVAGTAAALIMRFSMPSDQESRACRRVIIADVAELN